MALMLLNFNLVILLHVMLNIQLLFSFSLCLYWIKESANRLSHYEMLFVVAKFIHVHSISHQRLISLSLLLRREEKYVVLCRVRCYY